jgi:hypothetical protein
MRKAGELLNIMPQPNSPKVSATDLAGDAKYKSIKAFRTITTMLKHIPSHKSLSVVDMPPAGCDPKKDKELKLLNALATLLVRSNEVAAVAVTKHDDGSGNIQVIACHHHVGTHGSCPELTYRQPTSRNTITSIFKNFLVTFNPREDNKNFISKLDSDLPSIIDAEPGVDMPSGINEKDFDKWVETYRYDMW